MTQFHEGDDVSVTKGLAPGWLKAKIIRAIVTALWWPKEHTIIQYEVEFRDGSRAVVDDKHIRAVDRPEALR
jgi:hypothetical protein